MFVGTNKFTLDVWRDAVNTVASKESIGAPAGSTSRRRWRRHLKTLFELGPRGPVIAKHDRAHEMFFVAKRGG
jgi:adenylate cyclase